MATPVILVATSRLEENAPITRKKEYMDKVTKYIINKLTKNCAAVRSKSIKLLVSFNAK